MNTTPTHVNHTFPPVYDQNSRILILGTFPSVKSREGEFYYHHPQNRFWKVLSRIFGVDIPQTIDDKKKMLLQNRTAIWDVIASCDIIGSSDASIKNIVPNDISRILKNSNVDRIYANGNKAYELYMKHCFPATGREIIRLPSTSPANAAFSLDKLVEIWKKEILPEEAAGYLTLKELCQELSISHATGRNWVKSGRLTPDYFHQQKPFFSHSYLSSLKEALQTSQQSVLKSRRNKNYISGNQFYASYLHSDSPNISKAKMLLERIKEYAYPTDETGIGVVLADCALKLYREIDYVNQSYDMTAFFSGQTDCAHDTSLIHAFIDDNATAMELFHSYPEIFSIEYSYVPQEDLLGLLYLSMRNMGGRKTTGAYYTPSIIVEQLLKDLPNPHTTDTLLDPCCGTGNFLLQLSSHWKPEQIYAYDIDACSVAITRINLALKFPHTDTAFLCEHILCHDFLFDADTARYRYIIGNPPWGFTYSEKEKEILRNGFSCAGKNPESYDLFLEQAWNHLKENGILSFVLPEAVLTVKSHKAARQLICQSGDITGLTYLGNMFDGVWCPSVILQLKKTNQPVSTVGTRIVKENQQFTIKNQRPVTADSFHLAVTDEEYALIQKIEQLSQAETLKNNAVFALGIVTGDNERYLLPMSKSKKENAVMEPVLKGNDIDRYRIDSPKYCLDFQPEHFQQCAPVDIYRAPEKLFYRFIGQRLVFAYDDQQRISLNSCNIVIPKIEGLHMKYILTILNSRIAGFYVHKKWNSLKVLRSHLEQIPIPVISAACQQYYIQTADTLMRTTKADIRNRLYDQLDQKVAALYGLTETEYSTIYRHTILCPE